MTDPLLLEFSNSKVNMHPKVRHQEFTGRKSLLCGDGVVVECGVKVTAFTPISRKSF